MSPENTPKVFAWIRKLPEPETGVTPSKEQTAVIRLAILHKVEHDPVVQARIEVHERVCRTCRNKVATVHIDQTLWNAQNGSSNFPPDLIQRRQVVMFEVYEHAAKGG